MYYLDLENHRKIMKEKIIPELLEVILQPDNYRYLIGNNLI